MQLNDRDTFEENEEENFQGYVGETFQGVFAMVKRPETLGVMPTAYASEESQE